MIANKNRILAAAIGVLLLPLFSCTPVKKAGHGVGEATGKTIKTIKEVPGEIKEGYKEGRTSESGPAPEEKE
ncbi:MAG: hypothetical protein R6V39_10510 [Desulfovibrionales bacterium]